MNRETFKQELIMLGLLAIPVLPVSLWEMPEGSLIERAGAALALLAAAWVLTLGTINVLTSKALSGAAALALGLLLLAGFQAAGVFSAVGL